MKSLDSMIRQLDGLLPADLTAWEEGFISHILELSDEGAHTGMLTSNQVEYIQRIYNKHFGDGE